MHLVDIIGIGRTKTAEHWSKGLVDLAVEAAGHAMEEASSRPSAVVVANALSGALGDQRNLASYIAARLGLSDVETLNVEADEASSGAAVRQAIALIVSSMHENILVIGAEKTTDVLPDALEAARAGGLDVLREAGFGFSLPVAAALAMQQYMNKYGVKHEDFYHISALAHHHAAKNKDAFFPWSLSKEQYLSSQVVSDPVTVCDTAPSCDGAAAVMLSRASNVRPNAVRILGSSAKSVKPGIAETALSLTLPAANASAKDALSQAGLRLEEISVFDLHDSFTILAVLSLEALGIAPTGGAINTAASGALSINGAKPTWTFGGLKARGHTIGAAGMYQVVEAALQLRGQAGENQVKGAKTALVQCLGSFGATAVTHVLGKF